MQSGHRSDASRTVFLAEVGRFLGIIGMVSDMNRIAVRIGPEWCPFWSGMGQTRGGVTLEWLAG